MSTPTKLSLAKLRGEGWFCAIVEHWNSFTRRRQDLFQFGDILAIRGDEALIIQTTSGSNVSARLHKILDNPNAQRWLASPTRKIFVHGWRKAGPRGKRKTWQCREIEVTPQQTTNEETHQNQSTETSTQTPSQTEG